MMTTADSLALLRGQPERYDGVYKMQRWVTVKEAGVLQSLIASEGIGLYFESGTANGYSTAFAADALWLTRWRGQPLVHTWDPVDRPKVWTERAYTHLAQMVVYHQKQYTDSVELVVPATRLVHNDKALFFIDGDHRWHAAKEDIRATLAVGQPGEVMLLHDINPDYGGLFGRFEDFTKTHRTQFFPTERGMGAVWL